MSCGSGHRFLTTETEVELKSVICSSRFEDMMTLEPAQKKRIKSFPVDFLPGHKIISGTDSGIEEKRRLSQCVGCNGRIQDQYILRVAPDLEWHAACLKCVECQQFLDETCTCFVRDGRTYCKLDYVRLFGAKCERCGDPFLKSDYVMRARNKIYHQHCFQCYTCGRSLVPGDEFALREDGLFCKEDHDTGISDVVHTPTAALHQETCNSDSSESAVTTMTPSKIREGRGHSKSGEGKPTRVRTVLNEKQLHTLRTCYAANPRPDALMKEQLVEMTSLSPRVIRVWFQNKRCKDKKKQILMKQIQQQEKEGRKMGYGAMHGIPMIASSPVRHEGPCPAIDVHSYQPPWKALSDFALHTDLERLDPSGAPFRELVNQMHGYDLMHNGLARTPTDLSHHDSTDSYVTYLESDDCDSLNPDTSSP